jgi:hypothetical protein
MPGNAARLLPSFLCAQECPVLLDAEVCPCMPTVLRNFFSMLEVRGALCKLR